MVGHGLAEGGLNQAPAHVGPRELRDEQLFPFEAAVRHAGIASVMPAYCDVDGVPCHASPELLTTILRGEWGFDGIVASDYMGVEMIATAHRLTARPRRGGAPGARRGRRRGAAADRRLRRRRSRTRSRTGGSTRRCSTRRSARVLRMKFRLGLFDRPYVEVAHRGDVRARSPPTESRAAAIARRARRSCCVENDGVLPLAPDLRRVAVVGPIADSARDLLGDYSHLVHMETLARCARATMRSASSATARSSSRATS